MPGQSKFLHSVYFWLNEGLGEAEANELRDGCIAHLEKISGVLRLSVGFPAGTERSVVDSTYAVGLLVEFAGKAEHDYYQVHPDHKVFIEICHRLCCRVQVYDTIL